MKLKHAEIIVATLALMVCLFEPVNLARLYYDNPEFAKNMAGDFHAHHLAYNFTIHYFFTTVGRYLLVYFSFLWMAIGIPNQLIAERRFVRALAFTLLAFLIVWMSAIFIGWVAAPYDRFIIEKGLFTQFEFSVHVFALLIIYQIIKQTILWYVGSGNLRLKGWQQKLFRDIAWFMLLIGLLIVGLIITHSAEFIAYFVLLVLPSAFIIFLINVYWLLHVYNGKVSESAFWLKEIGVSFLISLPLIGVYCGIGTHEMGAWLLFFMLIWLLQLALVVPIAYSVYWYRKNRETEVADLRTDLGTSNASLQFLRSQINPHFLFNALNTLYGTALMEHAEKTSEGIQKLGDMMRFMLHENHLDKISLNRELDYLENYIGLQNLRLASSPEIEVKVEINGSDAYYEIAPMLLIPFIENAYKHGISLRERSWISINLSVQKGVLYFDVHNSVHPESEFDPERTQSGIGLENVKQRLGLLYAGRHELSIRKTTKEFFVHLTIKLV